MEGFVELEAEIWMVCRSRHWEIEEPVQMNSLWREYCKELGNYEGYVCIKVNLPHDCHGGKGGGRELRALLTTTEKIKANSADTRDCNGENTEQVGQQLWAEKFCLLLVV